VTRKTGPPTFLEPADQEKTTVSRPPRKATSSAVIRVERPSRRPPSEEQQTRLASRTDIIAEAFEEDVATDPFGPRRPVLTPAGQRAISEPEDRNGIPKRLTTSWETTQKVRLPPRRLVEEASVTTYHAQAPGPHFLLRHAGLVLILAMLFAAGVGLAMLAASDPLH
jgi:hypothetical protein